jgi:hypothetical protein
MEKARNVIDCFQRLVSLLYREIGVIRPQNHAAVAAKAKLSAPFFKDRKREAKRLYQETRHEKRPQVILGVYESRTGLTLEDIYEAFDRGKWKTATGIVAFGGPKWAATAKFTLDLRDAIASQDQQLQTTLVAQIDTLQHNNGRVVEKFSQLD